MFQFHQNNSQLLFHVIVSPLGAGAFSRGFTKILARQCRAFSRALKIEKLKAPLFPGPGGAGDTNDWCIKKGLNNFSRSIAQSIATTVLYLFALQIWKQTLIAIYYGLVVFIIRRDCCTLRRVKQVTERRYIQKQASLLKCNI